MRLAAFYETPCRLLFRGSLIVQPPQTNKYSLYNCLGFRVIQRTVAGEKSKDYWPINHVENDVSVDGTPDLATVYASPPHDLRGISSSVEETLSK